jgi:hypothetical protein
MHDWRVWNRGEGNGEESEGRGVIDTHAERRTVSE